MTWIFSFIAPKINVLFVSIIRCLCYLCPPLRGIQDVMGPQVQREHQGMWETLVPRESMVPVALKDILDPQDAEVLFFY